MATTPRALSLGAQEAVTLEHAPGATIGVERGIVWITEEGNLDDFILHAGDAHAVRGAGPVVIQAFQPSSLRVAGLPAQLPLHAVPFSLRAFIARRFRRNGWGWVF